MKLGVATVCEGRPSVIAAARLDVVAQAWLRLATRSPEGSPLRRGAARAARVAVERLCDRLAIDVGSDHPWSDLGGPLLRPEWWM